MTSFQIQQASSLSPRLYLCFYNTERDAQESHSIMRASNLCEIKLRMAEVSPLLHCYRSRCTFKSPLLVLCVVINMDEGISKLLPGISQMNPLGVVFSNWL